MTKLTFQRKDREVRYLLSMSRQFNANLSDIATAVGRIKKKALEGGHSEKEVIDHLRKRLADDKRRWRRIRKSGLSPEETKMAEWEIFEPFMVQNHNVH